MKGETVRAQVEIKASRRLHAAASTAHERHAAGTLCRDGQRGAGEREEEEEGGRLGLGRGGATRARERG
jgi:hypothetical protein